MGKKLSIQQVADDYGVSTRTIRRYIASGDLRAWRVGANGTIRIDVADLEKMLRPVGGGSGAA